MTVDLSPEQLKAVYQVFCEYLKRKKNMLDTKEWGLANSIRFYRDSEDTITDILRARLALNEELEIKKILEKRLANAS